MEAAPTATKDQPLECLNESLPEGAHAASIADRGFEDKKRHEHLSGRELEFIVRFRQDTLLTEQLGDQRRRVGSFKKRAAPACPRR